MNAIKVIWYQINLTDVHVVILKLFVELKEENTIGAVTWESKHWKLTLTVFYESKRWKKKVLISQQNTKLKVQHQ